MARHTIIHTPRTQCTVAEAPTTRIEAQQCATMHTPRTSHYRTVYIDGHQCTRTDTNRSERLISTSIRIILIVNIKKKKKDVHYGKYSSIDLLYTVFIDLCQSRISTNDSINQVQLYMHITVALSLFLRERNFLMMGRI